MNKVTLSGSLAVGVSLLFAAAPAHAQPSRRPVAGYYYSPAPAPTPARAVNRTSLSPAGAAARPAGEAYYYTPSQPSAPPAARNAYAAANGYSPAPRDTTAAAPVYYYNPPSSAAGSYYNQAPSTPTYYYTPTPRASQPVIRAGRNRARPGDDDDYGYKS